MRARDGEAPGGGGPGSADPARKSSRVAKDTARAVCASMAGMLRALVRRAASARKRAAADGDPPAFAAAIKPVSDGVLSQVVTHAHVLDDKFKLAVFGEMHAAASFGALAALAEDRASCARRAPGRPTAHAAAVHRGGAGGVPAGGVQGAQGGARVRAARAREGGVGPAPLSVGDVQEDAARGAREADRRTRGARAPPPPPCWRASWSTSGKTAMTCRRTRGMSSARSRASTARSSPRRARRRRPRVGGARASAAWRAPARGDDGGGTDVPGDTARGDVPARAGGAQEARRARRATCAIDVADGDVRTSADADADATPRRRGSPRSFWRRRCGRSRGRRSGERLCCAPPPSSSRHWSPPGPRSCPWRAKPPRPERAPAARKPGRTRTRTRTRTTRTRASSRWSFWWPPVWLLTYGDADPALEHGEVYDAADDGACYRTVARKRAPTLAEAATDAAWASAASGRRARRAPRTRGRLRGARAPRRRASAWAACARSSGRATPPPMTSKEAESAARAGGERRVGRRGGGERRRRDSRRDRARETPGHPHLSQGRRGVAGVAARPRARASPPSAPAGTRARGRPRPGARPWSSVFRRPRGVRAAGRRGGHHRVRPRGVRRHGGDGRVGRRRLRCSLAARSDWCASPRSSRNPPSRSSASAARARWRSSRRRASRTARTPRRPRRRCWRAAPSRRCWRCCAPRRSRSRSPWTRRRHGRRRRGRLGTRGGWRRRRVRVVELQALRRLRLRRAFAERNRALDGDVCRRRAFERLVPARGADRAREARPLHAAQDERERDDVADVARRWRRRVNGGDLVAGASTTSPGTPPTARACTSWSSAPRPWNACCTTAGPRSTWGTRRGRRAWWATRTETARPRRHSRR